MISEKIVLQLDIEKIVKSFVGGVSCNYNTFVTLVLGTIALLFIIIFVISIVVENIKVIKKTKFGKCCGCCSSSCSCCSYRVNLMSNYCCSVGVWQMQQQSTRFFDKTKNHKNFNVHWHRHHYCTGDKDLLLLLLPRKFTTTHAKRFATMMRV